MRAMFQFTLARGESTDTALARLESLGVAVDRRFGAIALDPTGAEHLARGEADDAAVEAATRAGFVVRRDQRVAPTKAPRRPED